MPKTKSKTKTARKSKVVSQKKTLSSTTTSTPLGRNQTMGILAYILFFIPLIFAKDSKFAMYHANQGLVLFLTALIVNVAGSVIPILGWMIILPLGSLAVLILAILGILNAASGQMKPLPVIGGFKLVS